MKYSTSFEEFHWYHSLVTNRKCIVFILLKSEFLFAEYFQYLYRKYKGPYIDTVLQ